MYIPAYAAYIYILPYTPYEGGSPTLNQENVQLTFITKCGISTIF